MASLFEPVSSLILPEGPEIWVSRSLLYLESPHSVKWSNVKSADQYDEPSPIRQNAGPFEGGVSFDCQVLAQEFVGSLNLLNLFFRSPLEKCEKTSPTDVGTLDWKIASNRGLLKFVNFDSLAGY